MYRWWLIIFLSLSFSYRIEAYEQDLLKENDISRIMQQILNEHVAKKEMTARILQHALNIYINQFDPHHLYLLESEISPYSSSKMDQIIDQYKQKDFQVFKQLNQVIQDSILRSRKIRQELEANQEYLFKDSLSISKSPVEQNSFAQTIDQLKERLKSNIEIFISKQNGSKIEIKSPQKREQIITSYEMHLREFENLYLYQNEKGQPLPAPEQENLFAIHVLKALANSLDVHTSFYQAQEAYDIRMRLQKEFKGIGLVLKDTLQGPVVTYMLEGGPAERSKVIQMGDVLIEIDDQSIIKDSFEKVMEKLHGEKGTDVKLGFKRIDKDKEQKYNVTLKRELIILNNDRVDVKSESFGDGIIGEITLHAFYQGEGVSSEQDVRQAIQKLEKQGKLRGLILDLRDNGGGFLSQAVKVAGLFITNGVIVISKYSNGSEKFYRDVDSKTAYDGPLIVLTSKATASAAEIVAQALQDYGVAVIVGDEHTYGKGTIQTQTVTDNQSTSYFKVTVGEYYTVSGRTPQKQGVKSDIVAPSHWYHEQIGEGDSENLASGNIPAVYEDQLKDIPQELRSWYLKYYIPKLQNKVTIWQNVLPQLRKNSEYRIANNKNYQYFLKGETKEEADEDEDEGTLSDKKNKTFGAEDLQMQEAVNILKDMVLLDSRKKNPQVNKD